MKYLYSALLLLVFSVNLNAEEIAISLKQRVESADNIYFGFISGVYYPEFYKAIEDSELFHGLTEKDGSKRLKSALDTDFVHKVRSLEPQIITVAVKETFQGKPKNEVKASTGLYGFGNDIFHRRVAVFENKNGAQAIFLDLKTYKRLINKDYLNDTFFDLKED